MARRTPDEELAFQMQKLKDMGVTISVKSSSATDDSPANVIAQAAREAGIYSDNRIEKGEPS